jgi:hypothetical protein
MKKGEQFHPGKLKPFAQIIAQTIRNNPRALEDNDLLWSLTLAAIPGLGNKENCPNCGGSMREYVFEFSVIDAALLFGMARVVQDRLLTRGTSFTIANQVHLPSIDTMHSTVRQRMTYTSKLGLIAKLKGKNDKHVGGTWVITRRGWAALRGESIPKSVRVWHGAILEHGEETTTIDDTIRAYGGTFKTRDGRNKDVKTDYRQELGGYSQDEWVHLAGVHQGELI